MDSLVLCGRYVATALGDCILPPLSSKVVKYIIESSGSQLAKILNDRRPFKPISVSVLFLSGKPLYSEASSGQGPLSVSEGSRMSFRVVAVGGQARVKIDDFRVLEGIWRTPYGEFSVTLNEVEMSWMSQLGLGLGRLFRIRFLTPTILTNKYMLPPTLRYRAREVPERHRLVPQPSYLFSYLLRLWNNVVSSGERMPNPSAGDWEAYKLGRLSDIALVEVDYSVRPTTTVVGRDNVGRLRVARGFTGWVTYECLSRRLLTVYDKLLALANYLGVGRSRGIGLGMVSVNPVSER